MISANVGSMKEHDWGTPPEILDVARQLMGSIDLDPCTSTFRNETVQASNILTLDDCLGAAIPPLSKWAGKNVFINPPGGTHGKMTLTQMFFETAARHMLRTEGGKLFFTCYAIDQLQVLQRFNASFLAQCLVCVPRKRIGWVDKNGVQQRYSPKPSALLYFDRDSTNQKDAAQVFGTLGLVWESAK